MEIKPVIMDNNKYFLRLTFDGYMCCFDTEIAGELNISVKQYQKDLQKFNGYIIENTQLYHNHYWDYTCFDNFNNVQQATEYIIDKYITILKLIGE